MPCEPMPEIEKLRASILIISETAYKDPSTDKCVPALQNVFDKLGAGKWEVACKRIVPDDVLMIQRAVMQDVEANMNLIITSGGTGFASKDVTPEVGIHDVVDLRLVLYEVRPDLMLIE